MSSFPRANLPSYAATQPPLRIAGSDDQFISIKIRDENFFIERMYMISASDMNRLKDRLEIRNRDFDSLPPHRQEQCLKAVGAQLHNKTLSNGEVVPAERIFSLFHGRLCACTIRFMENGRLVNIKDGDVLIPSYIYMHDRYQGILKFEQGRYANNDALSDWFVHSGDSMHRPLIDYINNTLDSSGILFGITKNPQGVSVPEGIANPITGPRKWPVHFWERGYRAR